jgi:hypothetical protein
VLLARTLNPSTFRLALMCNAVFSGTVFALLGYVYWATTDYLHGGSRHIRRAHERQNADAILRYPIKIREFV